MSAATAATTAATPSAPLLARGSAYAALATLCVGMILVVLALGRHPAARDAAIAAFAAIAAQLGALAWLERSRPEATRVIGALLVGAAACTAPVGWFFGPNSSFAAAIALLILLTGLLARTSSSVSGFIYAALAGGQLLVTALVLLRVLPDLSVAAVLVPGHPDWQHLAAHLATQGIFLGSFLAGRVLRDRYAEVQAEIGLATRSVALKTALLSEARNDYRRALRALKKGALSRAGARPSSELGSSEPAQLSAPSSDERETAGPRIDSRREPLGAGSGTHSTRLWMDAYRNRMRRQHLAVLALSAIGSVILLVIGRHPLAVSVGTVSMVACAALTLLQRSLALRRGDESSYWPWYLISVLSVGPALAFGLHSAFACVIAAFLFFGGFFRSAPGASRVGSRTPVLLAVLIAHTTVFALVYAGVLGDVGNQPILEPGHRQLEPLLRHVLVSATYVIAFASATAIDARFEAMLRAATRAHSALTERTDALIRTGQEIALALEGTSEGLFTGERVGRYEIGRLLASGAMGDVYEARARGSAEPKDGGRVALKLVRADRAEDPIALELLVQEASSLSRVKSSAVARILEAGLDAELPYVAMELIEGESLAEILRERGRLPLEEVRALAADLMRGVRDVHDAGVIHRDLKPHNLMRQDEGGPRRWKIVDFGLAFTGAAARAHEGGTAAYMAPEQALAERVDPRADLYSATLVLYRALTGRPAFVGADPVAIAQLARASAPPDPSAYVALPAALELVLRVGLAADPKERFSTARELDQALRAGFEGQISDKHRARAEALLARAPWSAAL